MSDILNLNNDYNFTKIYDRLKEKFSKNKITRFRTSL
jgi:hypothetical protein